MSDFQNSPGIAPPEPSLEKLEIERLKPQWIETLGDYVISLHPSPRGDLVAALLGSGELALIETESGKRKSFGLAHRFGGLQVQFSPDGSRFVTAGQDGVFKIWDTNSAKEIKVIPGGSAWVENIAWSPKGDCIAVSSGKRLKLYSAEGALVRGLPDHQSTVSGLRWSSDAVRLYSSCYGNLYGWEPESGVMKRHYEWKGSLVSMALQPQGRFIACGTQEGAVHCWDFKREEDMEMSGYPIKVLELAWNTEGRFLATGGGTEVIIWDFSGKGPQGSKPKTLEAHLDQINDLAFQPNGSLLASGAEDGALLIWEPQKKKKAPRALGLRMSPVTRVAWSVTGKQIFCGYADGFFACWTVPKLTTD